MQNVHLLSVSEVCIVAQDVVHISQNASVWSTCDIHIGPCNLLKNSLRTQNEAQGRKVTTAYQKIRARIQRERRHTKHLWRSPGLRWLRGTFIYQTTKYTLRQSGIHCHTRVTRTVCVWDQEWLPLVDVEPRSTAIRNANGCLRWAHWGIVGVVCVASAWHFGVWHIAL